jgi:hypothetical protein
MAKAPTQKPIIIQAGPEKWLCVTKYHATDRGNLFMEEAHDVSGRINEIIEENLIGSALDPYARRN